jgi:hypothetical protein
MTFTGSKNFPENYYLRKLANSYNGDALAYTEDFNTSYESFLDSEKLN